MEIYKTITSRDGKNRIDFEKSVDGFYRYVTMDDRYRNDPEIWNPPEWTLKELSGLYDTAEAVEADARATLDWLAS